MDIQLMCTNPRCGRPAEVISKTVGRTVTGHLIIEKKVAKTCVCGAEIKPVHV